MSPKYSIGGIKNDFWAYGPFGANRAPVLRQGYISKQTETSFQLRVVT
jgi:hypothetical protein